MSIQVNDLVMVTNINPVDLTGDPKHDKRYIDLIGKVFKVVHVFERSANEKFTHTHFLEVDENHLGFIESELELVYTS